MKVTFTKMRNLHKQVDSYDKRYNDTIGEIERVKAEITALRQEKQLYKENLHSIEEDIATTEKLLDDAYHGISS